jgi:invasion protein IalB
MAFTGGVNLLSSLLLSSLLAGPAVAQEATTTDTGPSTLSETYESWTVQCAKTAINGQPTRNCQMSQELLQPESRQRVLLFAIAPKQGEGATKATLVMPFGLLLSEGLRIEAADKELLRGTFRTCMPGGCISEVDLSDDLVKQMQGLEKLTVVMTANDGQVARTDVSLSGFSAAYRRLLALGAA